MLLSMIFRTVWVKGTLKEAQMMGILNATLNFVA